MEEIFKEKENLCFIDGSSIEEMKNMIEPWKENLGNETQDQQRPFPFYAGLGYEPATQIRYDAGKKWRAVDYLKELLVFLEKNNISFQKITLASDLLKLSLTQMPSLIYCNLPFRLNPELFHANHAIEQINDMKYIDFKLSQSGLGESSACWRSVSMALDLANVYGTSKSPQKGLMLINSQFIEILKMASHGHYNLTVVGFVEPITRYDLYIRPLLVMY
jgi:hypothetical protein